jgi:hypothetical protein
MWIAKFTRRDHAAMVAEVSCNLLTPPHPPSRVLDLDNLPRYGS